MVRKLYKKLVYNDTLVLSYLALIVKEEKELGCWYIQWEYESYIENFYHYFYMINFLSW